MLERLVAQNGRRRDVLVARCIVQHEQPRRIIRMQRAFIQNIHQAIQQHTLRVCARVCVCVQVCVNL